MTSPGHFLRGIIQLTSRRKGSKTTTVLNFCRVNLPSKLCQVEHLFKRLEDVTLKPSSGPEVFFLERPRGARQSPVHARPDACQAVDIAVYLSGKSRLRVAEAPSRAPANLHPHRRPPVDGWVLWRGR